MTSALIEGYTSSYMVPFYPYAGILFVRLLGHKFKLLVRMKLLQMFYIHYYHVSTSRLLRTH